MLLFSLLFSEHFCGAGKGFDGDDKVVMGDPLSKPQLGKIL